MFKLICLALLAAFANSAPAPRPKPILQKVKGQPVLAIWPTGDTAELRLNRNPLLRVTVPFQVTENECTGKVGAQFNFIISYRIDRFRWMWTKHTNPAKVGTPVRTKPGMLIEQKVNLTNPSHLFIRDLGDEFPRDTLEIADASWLPEQEQTLKDFTINTWFSEQMITNPENGTSENRIAADVINLQVVRDDATHARIEAVDSIDVTFFRGLPITVGDVVTWVFALPNRTCQISMKPDLGAKDQQMTKYQSQLTEDTSTYLWQQDTLSKMLGGDQAFVFTFVENADD